MKRLALLLLMACGVETTEPELNTPLGPVVQQPQQPQQQQQQPLTGFPCDVRAVLETNCAGCHLGQRYAPMFRTRDDLLAPFNDTTTYGARAVTLMKANEMPPRGTEQRPNAGDQATIATWVAAGMPGGECGPLTMP